jgi:hypothetical protein
MTLRLIGTPYGRNSLVSWNTPSEGVGELTQIPQVADIVHVRTGLHVEHLPAIFPFLSADV